MPRGADVSRPRLRRYCSRADISRPRLLLSGGRLVSRPRLRRYLLLSAPLVRTLADDASALVRTTLLSRSRKSAAVRATPADGSYYATIQADTEADGSYYVPQSST